MTTLTAREQAEVREANASGRQPVVFVHGLWLLPSSWDRWRRHFEEAGYATVAPGWPDDPETVAAARRDPSVFAGKGVRQVTDHQLAVIAGLDRTPAVVGHSFGGLIAQKLAGEGASRATVAIDPAPGRGVLPLPVSSLRSAFPVLGNPVNRGRAVTLTFEQFRYGWTRTLPEAEAKRLYDEFHVAAPGKPLFQAAAANLNPASETKVRTRGEDRGPMLIVSGEVDTTVPWALANAAFKRQRRNPGVTEIVEMPGRGHSLTIDDGWREVAQVALDFLTKHAPTA